MDNFSFSIDSAPFIFLPPQKNMLVSMDRGWKVTQLWLRDFWMNFRRFQLVCSKSELWQLEMAGGKSFTKTGDMRVQSVLPYHHSFLISCDIFVSLQFIGGACDPDLSRWSDLRVTWENRGLALFTKSRDDSHHSAATQRRFVSAEIYVETDISWVDSHDGAATQHRFVSAEIYLNNQWPRINWSMKSSRQAYGTHIPSCFPPPSSL
jgi:hypothetical protein